MPFFINFLFSRFFSKTTPFCQKIHQNGLNGENNAFLRTFFVFLGSRTEKTRCSLTRFLDPSHVFSTHSTALQSFRVATSYVPGRYVFRVGSLRLPFRGAESSVRHPQRGPPPHSRLFAPLHSRLHDPTLQTPRPSTSDSTTLHSFCAVPFVQKSVRDPKKCSRTSVFSVLSPEKKKQCARTLIIPKFFHDFF